jgi:multidrug efflux system membrane fusion protein
VVVLTGGAAFSDNAAKAPEVPVSLPVRRQVTDYANYTGRTEAVVRVDLRARVSGYLVKSYFKEGHEVRQDDLLFEIDPRPYQAELDKAQASLAVSEARLKRFATERQRAQQLAASAQISAGELDKILGAYDEAEAAIRVARAGAAIAQLNLSFTKVSAPCTGIIGRSLLAPGNVVKGDSTLLARIVTTDPMYVVFDMDESTLLHFRRAINAGKVKVVPAEIPVLMALHGDEGYPHQGTINFIGNQVDPRTGSMTVRAVFANPRPAGGVRLMIPGMFARIRMAIGQPHAALLVTQSALGMKGGQAYLYVVDAENKVQSRDVVLGSLQADGLREIVTGIKADDRIVVGGKKNLRPGILVTPKVTGMPTKG